MIFTDEQYACSCVLLRALRCAHTSYKLSPPLSFSSLHPQVCMSVTHGVEYLAPPLLETTSHTCRPKILRQLRAGQALGVSGEERTTVSLAKCRHPRTIIIMDLRWPAAPLSLYFGVLTYFIVLSMALTRPLATYSNAVVLLLRECVLRREFPEGIR